MKHALKNGDQVKIVSLKKRGVIKEIYKNGDVKVEVSSVTIRCKISEIELLKTSNSSSEKLPGLNFISKKRQPTSLDLHGYNSASAKEAIIQFISDSIMAGHSEVSIIHGHGTGTIKELVRKVLSELKVVAAFRHPVNSSASTKVYLK